MKSSPSATVTEHAHSSVCSHGKELSHTTQLLRPFPKSFKREERAQDPVTAPSHSTTTGWVKPTHSSNISHKGWRRGSLEPVADELTVLLTSMPGPRRRGWGWIYGPAASGPQNTTDISFSILSDSPWARNVKGGGREGGGKTAPIQQEYIQPWFFLPSELCCNTSDFWHFVWNSSVD